LSWRAKHRRLERKKKENGRWRRVNSREEGIEALRRIAIILEVPARKEKEKYPPTAGKPGFGGHATTGWSGDGERRKGTSSGRGAYAKSRRAKEIAFPGVSFGSGDHVGGERRPRGRLSSPNRLQEKPVSYLSPKEGKRGISPFFRRCCSRRGRDVLDGGAIALDLESSLREGRAASLTKAYTRGKRNQPVAGEKIMRAIGGSVPTPGRSWRKGVCSRARREDRTRPKKRRSNRPRDLPKRSDQGREKKYLLNNNNEEGFIRVK